VLWWLRARTVTKKKRVRGLKCKRFSWEIEIDRMYLLISGQFSLNSESYRRRLEVTVLSRRRVFERMKWNGPRYCSYLYPLSEYPFLALRHQSQDNQLPISAVYNARIENNYNRYDFSGWIYFPTRECLSSQSSIASAIEDSKSSGLTNEWLKHMFRWTEWALVKKMKEKQFGSVNQFFDAIAYK
jgi:hypothetical protein